jgi:predicted AlkP superfamily pyrophosphatase or phosphodiesterase
VIGIALKDRASILPAGRAADAAYWFDDTTGNWVTSTWYMKDLPNWVKQFNQQNLVEKYLEHGWNTLYPISTYVQSTSDNSDYERALPGTDAPTFPIDTADLYKKDGAGIIRSTPFGNSFTFDMARAAIQNEDLGQRDVTDFLTISLSSTDYVGHYFGPNSIEVEDTYLRLDQDLGKFLKYLDHKIGKGKYTLFLTADHGASHNLGFMEDHQLAAGAWDSGAAQKALNARLESVFGAKGLVRSLINYQVHFNRPEIEEKRLDLNKIEEETVLFLEKQNGVAHAIIMADAANAAIPVILRERILNSYNRDRCGAIQIILQPAWYSSGAARPKGATHSAIYPYDTHIPLIFMGWGIKRGETVQPTNITDIAPTLAALLHIQQPDGCIGTPILQALKLR